MYIQSCEINYSEIKIHQDMLIFCRQKNEDLADNIPSTNGLSQSPVTVKACGKYNLSGVGQTLQ